MGKRIYTAAGVCLLLRFGCLAFCQEPSQGHHLVMRFRDPGPPAVRQVEAKIGDCSNGEWVWAPARISRTAEAGLFEAAVEMPDAQCAMFRVKRLSDDPVPELQIVATELREATGPISPFDHAFVESYTNDDLRNLPRFQEPAYPGAGKPYAERTWYEYVPGYVVPRFLRLDLPWPEWEPAVSWEEATAVFQAAGLACALWPGRSWSGRHIWARVVSGDVREHLRRLWESKISAEDWSQTCIVAEFWSPGVTFTEEEIRELLSTMPELEPDWDAVNWESGPLWAVVKVPEYFEFAWIMALEAHPKIGRAELYFGPVALPPNLSSEAATR